jgi:hypothetical protein
MLTSCAAMQNSMSASLCMPSVKTTPMASPLTPMAIKAAYLPKCTSFAATRYQTGAAAGNADPCPRMTDNHSAKSARKTQAKKLKSQETRIFQLA